MSISKKPKNNVYIDSKGIVHNRKTLDSVLNKLYPTGYNSATRSSELTNGACEYFEIGNVVVVNIHDILCNSDITTHDTILFSNLPKPARTTLFVLTRYSGDVDQICRTRVETDGTIRIHFDTLLGGAVHYYGQVIYIKA